MQAVLALKNKSSTAMSAYWVLCIARGGLRSAYPSSAPYQDPLSSRTLDVVIDILLLRRSQWERAPKALTRDGLGTAGKNRLRITVCQGS